MHHVTSLNKSNPHMKPHFNKIIISTQQKVRSGFLRQHKTHRKDHLPSRSISKTLMASCVLSGRTSLAGSVCLLWIPGETEGGDCIGLMKGCAPTTDIIRYTTLRSPPGKKCFCALLLSFLLRRIASVGPCEDNRGVWIRIYRTDLLAVIHRLICI